MKSIFYFIAQTIFTSYCIFMGLYINGFFYMFLIGLLNIGTCFLIVSRKRRALIISILFYAMIFLVYTYLVFDMLIVKGFVNHLPDPFFMMGAIIHAPVILYCLVAVIALKKLYRNVVKTR